MGVRVQNIIPSGMVRDLAFGKHGDGMAYEIRNMRLNIAEDGSSLSWGNERGTERVDVKYRIPVSPAVDFRKLYRIGTVLGHAVIGDRLVMFCKISYFAQGRMMTKDCIISYNTRDFSQGAKSMDADVLYIGDLGFDEKHGIETVVCYENDDIQKVYWTDGLNQPRVINIAADVQTMAKWTDYSFNFARRMSLHETITVAKNHFGDGVFPCGTVQYAVSYYDMNSVQSNIAVVSDIHYITKGKRGGSKDETSSDSFDITVRNVDKGFGYIRLYSIIRTSKDAKPIVRVVSDKMIEKNTNDVLFHDTNTTGFFIASDALIAIGCEDIVVQSMDSDSNTLFLANIKINRPRVPDEVKTEIRKAVIVWDTYKNIKVNSGWQNIVYSHQMQLDLGSYDITIFKHNEWYRFGLQFQHESGKWSEVCYSCDSMNDGKPDMKISNGLFSDDDVSFAVARFGFNDTSFFETMYMLGFRRVRPVVVYTTPDDCNVLMQGIACPTLYNRKLRDNHSPDIQSSWFFRPNARKDSSGMPFRTPDVERVEWRDGKCLGDIDGANTDEVHFALEVQSDIGTVYDGVPHRNVRGREFYVDDKNDGSNDSNWIIDRMNFTINSPDLEYSDDFVTKEFEKFDFEIVGKMPITAHHSDYHIEPFINGVFKYQYAQHYTGGYNWDNHNNNAPFDIWLGCSIWSGNDLIFSYDGVQYPIHVWSRDHIGGWDKTYVNKDFIGNDLPEYGKFTSKTFASIRYSFKPDYTLPNNFPQPDVEDAKVFDSDSDTVLLLSSLNGQKVYMANVDIIAPVSDKKLSYNLNIKSTLNGKYAVLSTCHDSKGNQELGVLTSDDPVPIAYKSSRHIVVSSRRILPEHYGVGNSFLWIVDVMRGGMMPNRFGGTSDKALEDNVWVPCAAPVEFDCSDKNNHIINPVYAVEGDHYFMRYDCVKTKPYAEGKLNNVIEIGSFLLETRINLDGRYDRLRGIDDNTIVTDENFGLVNDAYTQSDDYFTYSVLKSGYENDSFPDQFTWSNTKTLGEDIDKWTNIDLLNTSDADGAFGPIRKIVNHNGKLIMFQDDAVARIPYNEKAAAQTTEGMLNVAYNTGVGNVEYISRSIGAVNKWSVCNTLDNLYFIDDRRRKLYSLVGEDRNSALEPVSSSRFFDSYFNDKVTGKEWTPGGWDNFRLSYDSITNDLYMSGADGDCLALNDIRKGRAFTSFYDYGVVPVHANVAGMSLMFADGNMWRMHTGDYNSFFGKKEDSKMCIVSNGGKEMYAADKVFNNIEYRADMFDLSNGRRYTNRIPFTKIRTWNEYQDSGIVDADTVERFRIWHANIPRDNTHVLDRMRNPWLMIELTHVADGMELLLHDLMVYYDNR